MCLLNYNKEKGKYKHITYSERTMIERWNNKEKRSKAEIARLLGKSERTIRREIKRGKVKIKGYEWQDIEEYSAMVAQDKYDYDKTGKGPRLILDGDMKLVEHIEREIVENKKSPEVIVEELEEKGYKRNLCSRTIRNGIKSGMIFEKINKEKIIYKKEYKNKNKRKEVSKMIPAEKSIEHRSQNANERSEYGHWEGDLIIGKRKKGSVLYTLTERMTREEIIIKIKGKKTENVKKAMDRLERKYGKKFYNKFKSITYDNGVEFMGYEGIENSCLRKKKRTEVYYAHPYCSGERGSNENNNRMIRRWIPKGTLIDDIKPEFIRKIEEWMNNYPRAMFDYKSSNMVLSNI